jgi:hypothetical protein
MTAQTVVGPLTWDKKGDIVDPKYVFFYIWKNGTYAEMETTLRRQTTASPAPSTAVDVGSGTGSVLPAGSVRAPVNESAGNIGAIG